MGMYLKNGGLALALMAAVMTGCTSSSGSDRLSSGEMAIERKAKACYAHGIAFMGKGHYLLARQQFSEAAAMAMGQELQDEAVAGLNRVDKIIAERR